MCIWLLSLLCCMCAIYVMCTNDNVLYVRVTYFFIACMRAPCIRTPEKKCACVQTECARARRVYYNNKKRNNIFVCVHKWFLTLLCCMCAIYVMCTNDNTLYVRVTYFFIACMRAPCIRTPEKKCACVQTECACARRVYFNNKKGI